MSMLTAQCDNLRLMARLVREYDYSEISRILREAADTIETLREKAQAAILGNGECYDIEEEPTDFCCSECGARLYIDTGDTYTMIAADEQTIIKRPNYCPNCGAKVIGDGNHG